MKLSILFFLLIIIFVIGGCKIEVDEEVIGKGTPVPIQGVEKMKLTSSAFEHNGAIPSEYTCDGSDTSPELNIEDVPENTKSLALINDDPDVPKEIRPDGLWVHWVVWNMPPETKNIPKGTEPKGIGGNSNFGRTGYGGPCPPSGTHRYFFKLYALDTELDLPEGSTKDDLEKAMQGHIIEKTELTGTYQRQ